MCVYVHVYVHTFFSATAFVSALCAIVPEKSLSSRSRSSD